jgi:aminodeoxyfutalosine deaminase
MPIYTAALIHDGNRFLPENSAIVVNENGEIIDILFHEIPTEAIRFAGLLCPGFINAHCHLELSYLQNQIPKHTGLVDFLIQINALRFQNKFTTSQIQNSISQAEKSMRANGIVAVGDICNGLDSLQQKKLRNLQYHSFVEIMGILDNNAAERFEDGKEIVAQFRQLHASTLVPHAAYSVSDTLLSLINSLNNNTPISIHNQECAAEDEWVRNGKGDFQKLIDSVLQRSFLPMPKNNSSLVHYLQLLQRTANILFVHNTFTSAEDILFAQEMIPNRYWVLCPNANLFIENTVPTIIPFLMQQQETICLGTDSLASNDGLCIYSEMQILRKHFPTINSEKLLQFATYNGAKALNMDSLGSFQKGKTPGVLHISNWVRKQEMPEKQNIELLH